ncbi:PE domain-containing protein [Pseudonocardia hispaniensis]|uniref:PE domain-containing protein n=1 Tax=Pseudonocardia hispaniensis TaxID=904933 RepID=A0ABW1IXV0_9PSEU
MTEPRGVAIDRVFGPGRAAGREVARAIWLASAASVPDGVPAGAFVVDPERAQRCIDDLGTIVEDLQLGLLPLQRLMHVAPSEDGVSRNVARNAALMARRAETYVAAWAAQLEQTRDALSRQLAAYRDADEANAGRRG